MLFANFIEIALILTSGLVLRSKDSINVESTPPLSAIEISCSSVSFFSISLHIEFSIEMGFTGSSIGSNLSRFS